MSSISRNARNLRSSRQPIYTGVGLALLFFEVIDTK